MYHDVLARSGSAAGIVQEEHRFRDLLREGIVETRNSRLSLDSLSDSEWNSLAEFVAVFFRECESYAPRERFPGYFREAARRETNQIK
jgi:hypothetical protein